MPDPIRLRQAVDASGEVIFMTDREGVFTFVNKQFEHFYGHPASEVVGRATPRILKGGLRGAGDYADFWARLDRGDPVSDEFLNRTKDGRLVNVEATVSPIRDDAGAIAGFLAIQRDITARKRAVEELEFQQTVARTERELTLDGILVVDDRGRVLSYNRRFAQMWNVSADLIGVKASDVLFKAVKDTLANPDHFMDTVRRLRERRDEVSRDEIDLKDGRTFDRYSAPMNGSDGRHYGRVWYFRDVTASKHADRALRESRAQLQLISDNVLDIVGQIQLDGTLVYASPSFANVLGYAPESLIGTSAFVFVHPDDAARVQGVLAGMIDQQTTGRVEYRYRRADGRYVWLETVGKLLLDDANVPNGAIVSSRDITERKRAEDVLREYDHRWQVAMASADLAVFAQDRDLRYTWLHNPQFGVAPNDALGKTDAELLPPDVAESVTRIKRRALDGRARVREEVAANVRGQQRYFELIVEPLIGADGAAEGISGASLDTTARRQLENQLRQSQKLEAIGSLAGGIAHDFNNLLTAIIGYAELAMTDLDAESPLRQDLEEIRRAGRSAEALTRQLLIFSRKSIVHPVLLDVNEIVTRVEKILRRVVGEHIEFDVRLGRGLGVVRADAGQLEQVLMNLVVNARDAMPTGGRITIETRQVEINTSLTGDGTGVGMFVSLAVSDTGTGMSAHVQAQIFDPFFTTKGPEKGTGLGLATVHAIVQQAGGEIAVTSEPGRGSTFTIYLPRVSEQAHAASAAVDGSAVPRGSETILFVEDNESIRTMGVRVLRQLGYDVLPARNSTEALAVSQRTAKTIHLLITDVVMPGLNGRALAERLLALRPQMKVVFTSGFTDDSELLRGIRTADTPFVQKPYTSHALARAIRAVLDRV